MDKKCCMLKYKFFWDCLKTNKISNPDHSDILRINHQSSGKKRTHWIRSELTVPFPSVSMESKTSFTLRRSRQASALSAVRTSPGTSNELHWVLNAAKFQSSPSTCDSGQFSFSLARCAFRVHETRRNENPRNWPSSDLWLRFPLLV